MCCTICGRFPIFRMVQTFHHFVISLVINDNASCSFASSLYCLRVRHTSSSGGGFESLHELIHSCTHPLIFSQQLNCKISAFCPLHLLYLENYDETLRFTKFLFQVKNHNAKGSVAVLKQYGFMICCQASVKSFLGNFAAHFCH